MFLNIHMIEAWNYQARKNHLTPDCGFLCLTGWSVSLHGKAQAGLSLGCLCRAAGKCAAVCQVGMLVSWDSWR